MKKKVCKNCKLFVTESECQNCKGNQFANNYQGRFTLLYPEKSEIGQKLSIPKRGEYAIKYR